MPGRQPLRPPRAAVRILEATLPARERDMVIGDLSEQFSRRVEAGRRASGIWFFAQACLFAAFSVYSNSNALRVRRRPTPADRPTRRHVMESFSTGLRQSVRRLVHDWRYSAAVILILSVGIGPAAAMLSVVENVLLRPLVYHEPERLGLLRIDLGEVRNHPGLSPAEAIDMRKSGLFASVETQTRLAEVSLGPPDRLVSLSQLSFTTGTLSMLGVVPVLGRNLDESDMPPPPSPAERPVAAAPSAPRPVLPPLRAMLDFSAWQTHFGGDRSVIGRLISINNRPAEIVGVLPEGFTLTTGRGVPQRIDIYTPLRLTDFRNAWQFPTLARIPRGTTFEGVQAGLDTLSGTLKAQYPSIYEGRLRFTISPLLEDMTRTTKPAIRAASAAVLVLLVIALANATALAVARLRSRARDFAIRAAIGAGRGALVIEVLSESVLLGAGGVLAGSVIAVAAIAVIREVIPRTVPRWEQIGVGWELVAYAAVLALAGLFLLGLFPVWRVSRGTSWDVLRSGSPQGGRPEGAASRLLLVGSQIALTVVLAFGCAQLMRSAAQLRRVDPGFDPKVLTMRVPFDGRRFDTRTKRAELYQRIRDRVALVPGVIAVGVVTHAPLSGSTMMDGYQADLSKEPSLEQAANYQAVTPGYFAALRIPFREGRDFTDREDAALQDVVIVDETLVRTVFPGAQQAIGRTLRLGWGLPNAQIIGVVGHARTVEVGRAVRPQIYVPIGNLFQNAGIVMVRANGDPRPLASTVIEAIREIGPGRAVSNVSMLSDNVDAATSTLRAVTALVTCLAISAGLLSAIGLYLVVAFVVHQQRRATAIRSALGASRAQVMRHHLRTSGSVMVAALPIGLLLSLAAAPLFADLAYGVGVRDAGSLTIALTVAVCAGALGTYVPVRRASNANVGNVLREG